ncbi:MAG: hypothetical protein ACRYFK_09315 [Janthinobacterium lividum]
MLTWLLADASGNEARSYSTTCWTQSLYVLPRLAAAVLSTTGWARAPRLRAAHQKLLPALE